MELLIKFFYILCLPNDILAITKDIVAIIQGIVIVVVTIITASWTYRRFAHKEKVLDLVNIKEALEDYRQSTFILREEVF